MLVSADSSFGAPEDEINSAQKEDSVKEWAEARLDDPEAKGHNYHQHSSQSTLGARYDLRE